MAPESLRKNRPLKLKRPARVGISRGREDMGESSDGGGGCEKDGSRVGKPVAKIPRVCTTYTHTSVLLKWGGGYACVCVCA